MSQNPFKKVYEMPEKIVTESEFQRECENYVGRFVYVCQSYLVDEMLKKEIFSYDDIENLTTQFEGNKEGTCSECEENAELNQSAVCEDCFEPEGQEIYEWWIVDRGLAYRLAERGEPILKNEYGVWWGRTCTGQAISIDNVIRSFVTESTGMKSNGEY